MSRYDDERFLLWFTRATPTWLELSAAARGVAISVAMELNPKTGGIVLRRGLGSLSTLLRIPWESLEAPLAELIAAGKLAWDGSSFVLSDPEYLERRRSTSTERVRAHRAKSQPPPADETHETVSPVTSVSNVTGGGETRETRALVSSSLVLSDLGSDQDQPDRSPRARETAPPVSAEPVSDLSPPAWWADACETVEAQTGVTLNRGAAWLRYYGHRATAGKRIAKPDAVYWLTTVDAREAQKDREERRRLADRDAKYGARAGPLPPSEAKTYTPEEQAELARRFPMRRRDRGAA